MNEFNNEVNVVIDNYVSSKLNVFSLTISLILGSLYIANLSVEIFMFLLFCAFITILINSILKQFKEESNELFGSNEAMALFY